MRNRLAQTCATAPVTTEFTDGNEADLECGLIERRDFLCGCVLEFALFTLRDNKTLVWTWRRLAPCRKASAHA